MKQIILSILLIETIFIACKRKNTISNTLTTKKDENIEIEFIKQGELWLKNKKKVIKKLDVELATTELQQAQGLMYRSFMEENHGMFFIFKQNKQRNFWMKNTRIPLDIIYLKEDSTVLNIAKNSPVFAESGINPSKGPVKFALEINATMSDKWGIKEGITKIHFEKFP